MHEHVKVNALMENVHIYLFSHKSDKKGLSKMKKNHKVEPKIYSRVIIANNLNFSVFSKLGLSHYNLEATKANTHRLNNLIILTLSKKLTLEIFLCTS